MDFMSRGGRTAPNAQPSANSNAAPSQPIEHRSNAAEGNSHGEGRMPSTMRYGFVALLFSLAILLASIGIYISTAGSGRSLSAQEGAIVNTKKYQALFLNGGQVYFGKIKQLNKSFVSIDDIYYLRVNQQIQPDGSTKADNQNISLAKLGNELHGPEDRMVINRDQVLFWENLKDDGQVVKAITEFKKNGGAANSNASQGTTNTNSSGTTTTTSPTPTTAPAPTPTPPAPAPTPKKP